MLKNILYKFWKFYNLATSIKKREDPSSYFFGMSSLVCVTIYILFLIITAIFFQGFFKSVISGLYNYNKFVFILVYILVLLPFDIYLYRYYKHHEAEFQERFNRERAIKEANQKKMTEDERCLECGNLFSKIPRYEDTNLCINCFNEGIDTKKGKKPNTIH